MTTTPPAGRPTPPIELAGGAAGVTAHLSTKPVEVGAALVERLSGACGKVTTDAAARAEASRDWWPLAMTWATEGQVAALASVIASPESTDEVADVVRIANDARVPITVAAGRSGVCGGSVPVFGGIVLDLVGLTGITEVDERSRVLDVKAGTFGTPLEEELRTSHNMTLGHWPQSIDLSTVGGWLACRSAGQFSNRYGKIEDMVIGLDVVLADGSTITTGGSPRQAVGPDLNQVFVGSEGTLGVITGGRLRLHPAPTHDRSSAWAFTTFDAALDCMRALIQRGATPAVLRLYDAVEGDRSYKTGDINVLLARDEGDGRIVDATMDIVDAEAVAAGATPLHAGLVDQWMGHRNDVSALEALISRGYVVDTMEISASWSDMPRIYTRTVDALQHVPGTMAASAHQSHSYSDGGCLYFTFAGKVEPDQRDAYYLAMWDAGQRTVLDNGGALSHHHGVGLNRSRFVRDALGTGFPVFVALKQALDPNGILNPGKLGLPSPFGPVDFP